MICYKTEQGRLFMLDAPEADSWISLTAPDAPEIGAVSQMCGIPEETLRAALDPEERSRMESDEGYAMILINVPCVDERQAWELYDTVPLAIILTCDAVITVCREDSPVLHPFTEGRMKAFSTAMKTRFVFQILHTAASLYLLYLGNIERKIGEIEEGMHRSTRNRELFELLKLQKSLVYFTSSLRANEAVLEKLMRTTARETVPEDAQLLEDAVTENRQALAMAGVYRGVLSSTTEAIASVISNNQNSVMKTLAIITIVMAIPTMFFSAYGMNVRATSMPLADHPAAFSILVGLSLAVSGVVALLVAFHRR